MFLCRLQNPHRWDGFYLGRNKIWGGGPGVGAGLTLCAGTAPAQLCTTPRTMEGEHQHIPAKPFPRKTCREGSLCAAELSWTPWQDSEGLREALSRAEALPGRGDLQQEKPFWDGIDPPLGLAERNPRHGQKKDEKWMQLVPLGWASRDRLGTISCLGAASLGSAHTGMSCSKPARTLPVPLSCRDQHWGLC